MFPVCFTPKQVLKHTATVLNVGVGIQFLDSLSHLCRIVRCGVVSLIKLTPRQAAHLVFNKREHGTYPSNYGVEVIDKFRDVRAKTVVAHIFLGFAPAHPFESGFKKVLSVDCAVNIGTPFLNLRCLRIAKHLLCSGDKRTGIHSIEQFLIVERYSGYVDCLEPFLYFLLRTFALINKQLSVQKFFA